MNLLDENDQIKFMAGYHHYIQGLLLAWSWGCSWPGLGAAVSWDQARVVIHLQFRRVTRSSGQTMTWNGGPRQERQEVVSLAYLYPLVHHKARKVDRTYRRNRGAQGQDQRLQVDLVLQYEPSQLPRLEGQIGGRGQVRRERRGGRLIERDEGAG